MRSDSACRVLSRSCATPRRARRRPPALALEQGVACSSWLDSSRRGSRASWSSRASPARSCSGASRRETPRRALSVASSCRSDNGSSPGVVACCTPMLGTAAGFRTRASPRRSRLRARLGESLAPPISGRRARRAPPGASAGAVSASSRSRHRQLPPSVAGVFIRASEPRPSTSCAGTTAVSATDARTARISVQFISCPSVARYSRAQRLLLRHVLGAAHALARRRRATSPSPCRCRACRCTRRGRARSRAAGTSAPAGRCRRRTGGPPCPASRTGAASASTSGVMTPRFSATSGSGPSACCERLEQRARPGPAPTAPPRRSARAGRDLPERLEPAEVIEPHAVHERERARAGGRSRTASPRGRSRPSRRAGCPSAGRSR